jgi:pimeloyl-ACP methyl ester carboxylesterase
MVMGHGYSGNPRYMPFIKHIYFEETGAGRPLIFLHPPALSHIYWRPVMERLGSLCQCIAIDIRGHGRSGLGQLAWTFHDIGGDIALLTRRLGLERPILVGYSSGGAIAMQAALDEPDLYSGLVLVSAFPKGDTLTLQAKATAGIVATNLGLTTLVGRNIVTTNHVDPAHAKALLRDVGLVTRHGLHSYLVAGQSIDLTAQLPKLALPILLVYGSTDDAMHAHYRTLMAGLPNRRAIFFKGVDHRVPTRRPIDFADAVAAFVAEVDYPSQPMLIHPSLLSVGLDAPIHHP